MANLGFSIGRGINLATKFAAGAGALEMIGKGNKAAGVVKDIAGLGSNVGAGASLSDRIRGGFSAVSPTFASAENIRSKADARAVTTAINKENLAQTRADATLEPWDAIFPDAVEKETKDWLTERALSQGLLEKSDDGSYQITGKNKRDGYAQLTDEVQERKAMLNHQISGIERRMTENEALGANAMEGMMMKAAGVTKMEDITPEKKASLKAEVEMAITNGTGDKALMEQYNRAQENGALMDKNLQTSKSALEAEESAELNDLQKAQAAKLDRENQQIEEFESTKIIESISRAEYGKRYSQLTTEEQDKVIQRREGQNPDKLRMTFDLKKQFDGLEGIKNYKKVQVNFDIMDSTITRVLSGDAETNLATDQTLVNTLNKIMDPASVVRESEFERTGQGTALRNKLEGWWNQVNKGGVKLRDEDRQELVKQAKVMMQSHRKFARVEADRMGALARSGNIDPYLVTGLEFNQQNDFDDAGQSRLDTLLGGG